MNDLNEDKRGVNLKAQIENRIKGYIEYSHELSNKYLKDKQRYEYMTQQIKVIRDEIQKTIKLFDDVLKVPIHLRKEIANIDDMQTEEIILKKAQLEQLFTLYDNIELENQSPNDQTTNQQVLLQEHLNAVESLKQLNDNIPLTQQPQIEAQKKIGPYILFLQGFSCLFAIICISIFIYKVAFQ